MSRVGQSPINILENVDFSINNNIVSAKGPKGQLEFAISDNIKVEILEYKIFVKNIDDTQKGNAIWGTSRAIISNMVTGVSEGFSKNMEIVGVGYRCALSGKKLSFNLGLSHNVEIEIPDGIEVKLDGNTKFTISGADKQKIGQFASVIRSKRPPEPFKGKGIRYSDEYVIRKEGKKK